MGYNTYTTDDLVSYVQLTAHIPISNNTFTATEIIQLANVELQTPIIKQIASTRGGYYLANIVYDQTQDGIYPIPEDAVAGALVNVELLQGTTIIPVNPIEQSEQFSTTAPTSTSYGYYFVGNDVQILPTPNVGQARLWYLKRPSTLVATTACSQVVSVDMTGTIVTVKSVPSTIQIGSIVDSVSSNPPFNILSTNTILDLVGTTITLDLPVLDLAAGDWIALTKQTCVPQIPVEFRVLLGQRVVVFIYEIQGYLDKHNIALGRLKALESDTFSMITPRVKDNTKIINPSNGGFLGGKSRQTNFPAGRTF